MKSSTNRVHVVSCAMSTGTPPSTYTPATDGMVSSLLTHNYSTSTHTIIIAPRKKVSPSVTNYSTSTPWLCPQWDAIISFFRGTAIYLLKNESRFFRKTTVGSIFVFFFLPHVLPESWPSKKQMEVTEKMALWYCGFVLKTTALLCVNKPQHVRTCAIYFSIALAQSTDITYENKDNTGKNRKDTQ